MWECSQTCKWQYAIERPKEETCFRENARIYFHACIQPRASDIVYQIRPTCLLTLSVRDLDHGAGAGGGGGSSGNANSMGPVNMVKHYRVKQFDQGGAYITTRRGFPDLRSLVSHYSRVPDGLCCRLSQSCPRPTPVTSDLSVATRHCWEVSRTSIRLVEQLGAGQFGEVWKGILTALPFP
ncbi:unnamed protein product [Protopolystoma xenopodis]|uniref:SH2 domain-containing protein n=1 Tax=Protopolystoma xenopodis TaxID=117903 RepID=A0A448WER9_9PLAT|nr:unnamed protein product [Protopolystoma xenopodis]